MDTALGQLIVFPVRPPVPPARSGRPRHLHRFRRSGDDPFSGASLHACRCGVVRPGM